MKRRGIAEAAWLEPLHGAIKKLPPFQCAAVANQAAYGAWCQSRLFERSMVEHPQCLFCGERGTVYHRMMSCPAWEPMRMQMLSGRTRAWAERLPDIHKQHLAD
eukprot:1502441-Amphidinium_carterae.1